MSDPVARLNAALEGRYSIERELGQGGMATVYLADDLKHERKVALKVLKPELAAVVGAERFLAEIKTTANLQHPHILPLFDSGEADSFLFYVMPYVEGESLRSRLDREHQLSVEEAVRIATNVAEGLHDAHERGVIHRDIKPANILLHAGKPMISDFGIALAVGVAGATRLTETGLSVGTPHYMSPEQATGDEVVGPSTDIYALGCVLYEMLVGDPPYLGSTAQAILGKIITGDPDPVRKHRKSIPPNVDAAAMKSLERLPADRFVTAEDFADALSNPAFRHAGLAATTSHEGGPWRRAALALAGLSTALAALSVWAISSGGGDRSAAPPVVAWTLTAPPGVEIDANWGLVLSPDERTIVFHDWQSRMLFRRDLDNASEALPIPGTESSWKPFFSPEGASIGFFDDTDNLLERVDLDGSNARTLGRVPASARSGRWDGDGTIVFNSSGLGGLSRIAAIGGEAEAVEGSAGSIAWFDLLPGGRTVVGGKVIDEVRTLVAVDLETGEEQVLFPGVSPRFVETGHLLYGRDGDLWAVPFDPDGLEQLGTPSLLAQGVRAGDGNRTIFDVTENLLVYWPLGGTGGRSRLVWVDRQNNVEPLDLEPGNYARPRISPDGERVAYGRSEQGNGDIWVLEVASGARTRITVHPAADGGPVWTPDGERLVFSSERDGARNLYWRAADGSDAIERLTESTAAQMAYGWTPEGSLLFTQDGDVWTVPAEPGAQPVPLMSEGHAETHPQMSPDGRFILVQSEELGFPEVFVRSYPDLQGSWMVSTLDIAPFSGITNADRREARSPAWSPSGDEIYYMSGYGSFVRVPVSTEGSFVHLPPDVLLQGDWGFSPATGPHYDAHPDGERFLMVERTAGSQGSELVVVQNWLRLLGADGSG